MRSTFAVSSRSSVFISPTSLLRSTFPRTLDAAMVVATDALLAARGWAENNFPRTMQAIAERLGGASYESAALETGSFRFPQVEREGSGGDQV